MCPTYLLSWAWGAFPFMLAGQGEGAVPRTQAESSSCSRSRCLLVRALQARGQQVGTLTLLSSSPPLLLWEISSTCVLGHLILTDSLCRCHGLELSAIL